MLILPYRDHTFVRFLSARTREVLFEIKMLDGAMIVWGQRYRPSELEARVADGEVRVRGVVRDRLGPIATFDDDLRIVGPWSLEFGELPPDYDASWRRDES